MNTKTLELVELLKDGLQVQNDVIDQMIENLNELQVSLRDLVRDGDSYER